MQKTQRATGLASVADALILGDFSSAEALAARDFPWKECTSLRRSISKAQALRVFLRDGFVDRYSGSRLVFPGALVAIGRLMPATFKIDKTWKVSGSHEIFWELWPVVDHVIPVTRNGSNDDKNLVTTSVTNNNAKGNALLSELEWELLPEPVSSGGWDGLIPWFKQVVTKHSDLLSDGQIKAWNAAVRQTGV